MRQNNIYLIILFNFLFIFLTNCSTKPKSKADRIIQEAIQIHGGELPFNAKISFDFRDKSYMSEQKKGQFSYQRIFEDSTGKVIDSFNNQGFTRTINGKQIDLSSEWSERYQASVNAVFYFTLLPFKLNDTAVIKKYLGKSTIENQPYHKIQVTFKKEGGGEDFEDVFVYWFHQHNKTMDYFAYTYMEEKGKGTRFRKAFNIREIEGIRFQDYYNYKGAVNADITTFDQLFNQKKLEKISVISNKNIQVTIL